MEKDLQLSPEEQAELDKQFPAGDPATDPEPEPKPESTVSPEEILGALENLGVQLQEMNTKEDTPAPNEGEEGWVPKDWNEVASKMSEAAEQALEDRSMAAQEAQQNAAKEQENLGREIEGRLETLEKSGRLPKMVDSKSDTDPGVIARRELFAYASQFNTMDFEPIMDTLETAHKAHQYFDYKTFKWTNRSPNPGKYMPVGSSSRTTPAVPGTPDAKFIRGHTLDQLAAMGSERAGE